MAAMFQERRRLVLTVAVLGCAAVAVVVSLLVLAGDPPGDVAGDSGAAATGSARPETDADVPATETVGEPQADGGADGLDEDPRRSVPSTSASEVPPPTVAAEAESSSDRGGVSDGDAESGVGAEQEEAPDVVVAPDSTPVTGPEPGPGDEEAASEQDDPSGVSEGAPYDSSAARSGDTLVAASFSATCAVRADGGVWCWGTTALPGPPAFAGFEDAVAVSIGDSAAGEFHACVLHADGRVSCWGPGHWGQLGRGNLFSDDVPGEVPGISDAVGIAAGAAHTCAVHSDGGVSCWGDGAEGQMGDGTTNPTTSPQRVPGLEHVVAISAGSHTNCVIHIDGTVSCWGWRAGHPQTLPRKVSGLDRTTAVAIGYHESCAVRDDGRVYCWPHDPVDSLEPVPDLSNVVTVSVGDRNACAVHRDGSVSCWGENNSAGQLGDGTTTSRRMPRRLAEIADAAAVTVSVQSSGGEAHACAAHLDGAVSCWGSNGFGQLGDGTNQPRLRPIRVQNPQDPPRDEKPTDAVSTAVPPEEPAPTPTDEDASIGETATSEGDVMAQPDSTHPYGADLLGDGPQSGDTLISASHDRTCAVRGDRSLSCWGRGSRKDRVAVAGLDNVVSVSVGDALAELSHACVLHGTGAVSCWGSGHRGQLGQGSRPIHSPPVRVSGISDAVAVAAGALHTCAVHEDGAVSCWGGGEYGQMGDGEMADRTLPQRVPGLGDVSTIAAGVHSVCAVHFDGTVSCWGSGFGAVPKVIAGLGEIVSVGAAEAKACAVAAGGELYCWLQEADPKPIPVEGVGDAVAVSTNDHSVCALHRDGGVSCWSDGDPLGEEERSSAAGSSTPTRLASVTDAAAVTMSVPSAEGETHTCLAHADGSVSCWGTNRYGQLGFGTVEPRTAPTRVERFPTVSDNQLRIDPTNLLRARIDTRIEEYEPDNPWLRVAWDHIRDRTVAVESDTFLGSAPTHCALNEGSFTCATVNVLIADTRAEVVFHELAHVYDLTTGLAPNRAWGAIQLSFSHDVYSNCAVPNIGELIADTLLHLAIPTAPWTYHDAFGCDESMKDSVDELKPGLLSAMAGEVPGWYVDEVTSGTALWELLREAPYPPALANLADEFGGLCSTSWIRFPLDPARFPDRGTNPFKEGGC